MSPDLQRQLFAAYPRTFRRPSAAISAEDGGLEPELPAPIDVRGIECGDGWYALIDQVAAACEADIEQQAALGADVLAWPCIRQVKEKFGVLIVVMPGRTSEASVDAYREALRLSATICEQCGRPGELRTVEWQRTTCAACEDLVQTRIAGGTSATAPQAADDPQALREILDTRPDFASVELLERMQADQRRRLAVLLQQIGDTMERLAAQHPDSRLVRMTDLGDTLSPTAVIDGTQLPVVDLFRALAHGQSLGDYCAEHPELPPGQAVLVVLRAGRLLEDTAL